VLQLKQKNYDNIIASVTQLKNVEILHLDGDDENYNVKEKIRYYNDRVETIVNVINKDKINAVNYNEYVDQLRFEIIQDFKTGDLYKIQASYYARKQFFEDYKKLREENPEKFLSLVKEADRKWAGNTLANGIWNPY